MLTLNLRKNICWIEFKKFLRFKKSVYPFKFIIKKEFNEPHKFK